MQHSIGARGLRLRRILIAATALCAIPYAGFAADLPPTPEGAQKLNGVFTQYLGSGATSVAVQGDHYAVSLDFAKLLAPLAAQGLTVEAAPAQANLIEQSDGGWRVTRVGYSPMTFSNKEGALSIHVDGYAFDGVFDPTLFGFRNADTKMDRADVQVRTPDVDETVAFAPTHVTVAGTAASGGGYSGTIQEDIGETTILVTPKKQEGPQPAGPTSIKIRGFSVGVALDNMRLREILDLWAFFVAHPSRAALASEEDALKTKLRALIPLSDKVDETFSIQNIDVETAKGSVKVDGVKGRFAAEKFPSKGDFEVHLAASQITPPQGVIPAGVSDLVPTAIDLNVKYGGYDYASAVEEAINDMHLAGEGPIISEPDRTKIPAKLMGGGPITFTILPSHLVGPKLDLSLEGSLQVSGNRPVGKLTIKARNFESTYGAIKAAGPQLGVDTAQVIAALTLAKGLGKSEADGSLSWVTEYGADGSIKVNGLALGKMPAQ